jgi:hypothetical protein
MRKCHTLFWGFLVFGCMLNGAMAQNLKGVNWVGGMFSISKFGDDEAADALGNAYGVQLGGNLVLNKDFDLHATLAEEWANGDQNGVSLDAFVTGASIGLIHSFKPHEKVNPYVGVSGLLAYSYAEASGGGRKHTEDDTDVGASIEGGLELVVEETILIDASLNYSKLGDSDGVGVDASLGYWFSERTMGFVGGAYDFDDADATGYLGLIFKFPTE